MSRDQHRQRVYDAEEAAFGGTLLTEALSWDDVRALFHAALHHPWWCALNLPEPHIVRARCDSARSSSDGRRVRIARGGQDALTVAHELAHHVAAHRTRPGAAHGPEFCAALLRTVVLMGGTAASHDLQGELTARRVPVGAWTGPEPPDHLPLASTLDRAGPGRVRGAVPLPAARLRGRILGE